MKAITIGGITLGALILGFMPIWKDMHHSESKKAQTGFGILYDQVVLRKRAKHIPSAQAIAIAKARYMLGSLS